VPSPSLTLDSGRGSSSTPSSPIKEMSPMSSSSATTQNTERPNSLFFLPYSQNKSASSEVSSGLPKRENLLAKSHQNKESQDLVESLRLDCCKRCGLNLKYTCSCPPEPIRKDSLEDDEPPQINMEDFLIPKSTYKSTSPTSKKNNKPVSFPMDDLNVPNEVFANQNINKTLNNNSIPMIEDLSLEPTCSSTGNAN